MGGTKGAKGIHDGHRQRMHERVKKYGLDSLAEHEELEYILFFVNARGDTNPTAHALLERFGDLAGVLEADEEELCRVDGVGPQSARFLHTLPQICACYSRSRASDRRRMDSTEQIGRYVVEHFRAAKCEQVLLITMSKQHRITGTVWLNTGSEDRVDLPFREAIAQAVRLKAHFVVIAHNHPSGNVLPSREDVTATAELFRGLYILGIELLDHIIVSNDAYLSMRQRDMLPTMHGERMQMALFRDSEDDGGELQPAPPESPCGLADDTE